MARRNGTRIEPTFDGPSRRPASDDFALDEDDRVLPSQRKRAPAARKAGKARREQRRAAPRRRRLGLGRLFYWCCVLMLWAGIGLAGIVAWYGAQLPSVANWSIPDRPPNVKIVAVDGAQIANRGMTGGEAIGLHEMSPYIPQAVMAIEDRRFYSHFGVDPIGLARAMLHNVLDGSFSQGGSTLTQQLAKNLFLQPDRTIERKVQEVLLALWLEHEHSKDQILEMYLNRVYFGSGAYGVEAASRRYFGKSARDVTLSEAALLAGLLKAPSRLSPARDPQAAERRAQLVLAAMRDEGLIGENELTTAMSAPATRAAAFWTGSENYVADRVMGELPALIGDVRADIVVDTTIDLDLQQFAEKSIRRLIDENRDKLDVSQGALVSIDSSGAVRAMVGGYDYANSQFDRASEARRQPGSAFKPFVFLAAMEQGVRPDSMRNDAPIRIGKWSPQNYNGKYYGQVTLATALAKSLNSVAAQLVMEVGAGSVVEAAQRMGIQSELQANNAIALGTSEVTPLELTAAYVPFANGGYRPDLHFVRRVTTAEGKVLYEHPSGASPRVISPEIVGMMNAMMKETLSDGTARKARFGWPAAGKTGTSQKSRDAWFVGYTANLTTGVWFGNDDGRPMKKVTGGALPTLAWHEFMAAAHQGVPVAELPGRWEPVPDLIDESVPDAAVAGDVGGQTAEPVAGLPQDPAVDPVAYPTADDPTASIRHPVPSADVGGPAVRRQNSILDIILGNGG
ncbi:transglycosylase domain-containing protein [Kumtagia ephedrae]|uniref:Penicillin-binding protein n=1 Tax=Kumtagia ephedrae TaxID=2116701 RepID=A0A2P7S253_9HYPH|nr:transglycosylase domain-containing protein [Mesorhizobium ephedrae]PSJ56523.1 penicillin-binding protein [Mesorhizobium ephedrae]